MKLTLFYLKTGGGHLSTAKSIAEELKERYNDEVESIMIDGLDKSPIIIKKIIEDGYSISSTQLPLFWKFIYTVSMSKSIMLLENVSLSLWIKKYVKKRILEDKPDKIVIVHFFLIKPVLDVLAEENLKIPTLIVTTDPFTPPHHWFVKNEAKFIVFSEEAKALAIEKGVPEENITISPIIINKKFSQKLPLTEIKKLKKSYGFDPNKKLILIAGGGDGLYRGQTILKNMLKADIDAQFGVVCGKNKILKKSCERIKHKYPDKNIQIYGYTDFMYELMNMADVIVTKGGPATVMEILMLGKPMIITSYVWAQEKGNVEFVVKNKLGYFEPNPSKVPSLIRSLLYDRKVRQEFQNNLKKLNILKDGSEKIATYILNYADLINTNKLSLSEILEKIKTLPKEKVRKILHKVSKVKSKKI